MTAPSIIIVTGSRHAQSDRDVDVVLDALRTHVRTEGIGDLLYVGDATGVDAIATWWAQKNDVARQVFEAHWTQIGKAAGPERNERMVAAALALRDTHRLVGLAFPGPRSRGTWDCVERMRRAGIDVHTWEMSE